MKFTYAFTTSKIQSIEDFLIEKCFSKDYISFFRQNNDYIKVNNLSFSTKHLLNANDCITITLPKEKINTDIVEYQHPISVLYEDEDLLVVDKEANMPVHPSKAHYNDSLANCLLDYQNSKNEAYGYHCITRLDTDTTGIVLLAKNKYIASLLNKQIKSIKKEYIAIVEGKLQNTGKIIAPIAKTNDGITRIVSAEGQMAITNFQVIDYDQSKNISIIKLNLETGRTHQIRVHMKYIGHPLIADKTYNPNYKLMTRQALHVSFIQFTHPISNQEIIINCPLPNDFLNALQK